MEHLRTLVSKLKMPPYVWCACFACIGGFIFGFDTGSIGSISDMDQFDATFGPVDETLHGLVVSAILLPAALISLVSGNIADRFSRTYAISLGAGIFGIGSWLDCFAGLTASRGSRLAMLFVGRCIAGLGEGIFLSTATVYSLEISPRRVRGKLGTVLQVGITTGILLGYFVCYGTMKLPSSLAWRIPFGLQGVVCAVLCAGAPLLPHSPRWLLHVGRRADAERTLLRLGITEEEKAELLAHDADEQEKNAGGAQQPQQHKSHWRKSADAMKLVWSKEYRSRTLLALYMQGTQQLAGIDGVLYYAPLLFQNAGMSKSNASLLASGGTGLVNLVFTLLALHFSDRWGRRPALIYGGLVQAVAMTLIGILYATPAAAAPAGKNAVIALIFVYFVAFVSTWAIHVRVHVAEAQPVATRALVASLGQTSNWLVNFVVAFTTPIFLKAAPSGPYFLWGGSIWLAVLVFACFLPETKGKVLEARTEVVASPVKQMVARFRGQRAREKEAGAVVECAESPGGEGRWT